MPAIRSLIRGCLIGLLLTVAVALVVPLVMRHEVSSQIYQNVADVPAADAALVLGASVERGYPSPVLADRADIAIELYKTKKVQVILVSGDNSEQYYDEVNAVRRYLIAAGIPSRDIFLDHAGFDTYSSMYRARDVFEAHSITIVTQDFHLPRALFIADTLGLNAHGIAADTQRAQAYNYVREIPASLKAVWDLMTQRKPKYLGPAIPLTGDGEKTWF